MTRASLLRVFRSRTVRGTAAVLTTTCAVLGACLVPTTGGTLTGRITNSTDQANSGITNGACTSTAATVGPAYFVWPLDDGPAAASAWDSSRNSRPGDYTNTANIAYGALGPCPKDNSRAVTLSGGSGGGYVTSTSTTPALSNPTTFSAGLWFKTSTTSGGKLIGFGAARTGQSGQYDRHIYMTTGGILYAGVYANAVKTVDTGTVKYNDGVWHFAMITLGTNGLCLYVDATSKCDTSVTSAENISGWWRVGYDNINAWPNNPTNYYFAGSIAFAQVYAKTLTSAQVTSLYNAGR